MSMKDDIKELEARIIERVLFWDGAINLMIRLRDDCLRAAEKPHAFRVNPVEDLFKRGMQEAINAALVMQQQELAECLMLAGIGGERAKEYVRERAQKVLGDKLDYAVKMGYAPTFWHDNK
jgi:hypothetical protein